MKKTHVLLLALLSIWFIGAVVSCEENPPYKIILNVPFHVQRQSNYCGVACIKMWADKDLPGNTYTQETIAYSVGVNSFGVTPENLADGVSRFTSCNPYLFKKPMDAPGARGDLITAAIRGIEDDEPSIIPQYINHAVLIIGAEWRIDANNKPVALNLWYHDPSNENGKMLKNSASTVNNWFCPILGEYWIIVPWRHNADEAAFYHDNFVMMGGYYYGGPKIYNPKKLNINPNPM